MIVSDDEDTDWRFLVEMVRLLVKHLEQVWLLATAFAVMVKLLTLVVQCMLCRLHGASSPVLHQMALLIQACLSYGHTRPWSSPLRRHHFSMDRRQVQGRACL